MDEINAGLTEVLTEVWFPVIADEVQRRLGNFEPLSSNPRLELICTIESIMYELIPDMDNFGAIR